MMFGQRDIPRSRPCTVDLFSRFAAFEVLSLDSIEAYTEELTFALASLIRLMNSSVAKDIKKVASLATIGISFGDPQVGFQQLVSIVE